MTALFQKRHYEALAAILKRDIAPYGEFGGAVDAIAHALEEANPNFDKARFLAACVPDVRDRYPFITVAYNMEAAVRVTEKIVFAGPDSSQAERYCVRWRCEGRDVRVIPYNGEWAIIETTTAPL